MKNQFRTMIKFTLIGLAILTFIYFGFSVNSLQDDKVDQLIIALDDEITKNHVLRKELDLLKLENDKVQTYIDLSNRFHLDSMDQLITSNNREISQMRELLSHLPDIEVRYGKILSYTQKEKLLLEVDFENETVEGNIQMLQVTAETSVFLIDVIGPTRAEQAHLIELLDSSLSSPSPQYETFTFVYVKDELIQIYQGQYTFSTVD